MNKPFYFLFTLLSIFTLLSCSPKAEQLAEEAIEAHGGEAYQKLSLSFDFREIHYDITKDDGLYSYQRVQMDTLGRIISDRLTNEGFIRSIDGDIVTLPDCMVNKYSNSVNSVAYFMLLPSGLNDPAVNKEYLGATTIKGENYEVLKVSFDEEGGGTDHQDIFMFWINSKSHLLDYLAYSYETDGGGVRFREATNRQQIGEITFQDYNNYGFEEASYPLENLPLALEDGSLPLLSEIKNENIQIREE
ncbi:DUF6503 family protein [Jiulongibacter sp. NS-SX5]|uniref:DUF6503 family protein n=1 Tax=Jiulongibacter sp. NS-SX5 TaxID=3463854 RepID=UPI0040587FBF